MEKRWKTIKSYGTAKALKPLRREEYNSKFKSRAAFYFEIAYQYVILQKASASKNGESDLF